MCLGRGGGRTMLPSRDQQHEEHRDWNKLAHVQLDRVCKKIRLEFCLETILQIPNVGPNPPCRAKWGTGLKLHTCTTLHLGTNRAINRSLYLVKEEMGEKYRF